MMMNINLTTNSVFHNCLLYLLILLMVNSCLSQYNQQSQYNDGYQDYPQPQPQQEEEVPLKPIVNVDKSSLTGERHVGVNVPGVYEMDLLHGYGGTGMGINVLKGLVRVGLNRQRNPWTGQKQGPISVNVLGVPIFGGQHY